VNLLFFLGKGGVGKSSLSVLSALSAAQSGYSVGLISLDRAHNLFDILGGRKNDASFPVPVIEADIDRFVQNFIGESESQLRKSYSYLTAINLEKHFKILRYAPGMEEYGLLLAFQHYVRKFEKSDYLIFDMPPTAISLKFFALPSVSLVWLDQLLNLREEILNKKEIISGVRLGRKTLETDKIKKNLIEQQKRYQMINSLFRDGHNCRLHIVTTPDSISVAESKRIINFLKDLRISVHKLLVNQHSERDDIEPFRLFFKKNNAYFIPKSAYPLIGVQNLEKYLNQNEKVARWLVK